MPAPTPQTVSSPVHQAIAAGDSAVADAQRMFRRVLAPWASDLLELRRTGLARPTACPGTAAGALPGTRLPPSLAARPADCEASGTWQHALTWPNPSPQVGPASGRAAA